MKNRFLFSLLFISFFFAKNDVVANGFLRLKMTWNSSVGHWTSSGLVQRNLVMDVNGDGKEDLVRLRKYNESSTYANVRMSNGNGFYSAWDGSIGGYSAGGYEIQTLALDFNGDGKDDLLRLWKKDNSNTYADVRKSNGTGFSMVYNSSVGGWSAGGELIETKVLDFNGDGKDDLVRLWKRSETEVYADVRQSNGSKFTMVSNSSVGLWSSMGVKVKTLIMDFDGDGKDDLVRLWKKNESETYADVRRSTGTGFVQIWNGPLGGANYIYDRMVMDVNGDGKDDLVSIWNNGGDDWGDVRLSTGTSFSASWIEPIGKHGTELEQKDVYYRAMDMNGDGKSDLVKIWKNNTNANAEIFLSYGNGFYPCWNEHIGGWGVENNNVNNLAIDLKGNGQKSLVRVWRNGSYAYADVRSPQSALVKEKYILLNTNNDEDSKNSPTKAFNFIATNLGSQENAATKVGICVNFIPFRMGNRETALRNVLAQAKANKVPVLIHIDSDNFLMNHVSMNWNDPANTEWNDWGRENVVTSNAYLNWGSEYNLQRRPVNKASDAFINAILLEYNKYAQIVADWYSELSSSEKYLLVGWKVGWETSIGINDYYKEGSTIKRDIGYSGLTTLGLTEYNEQNLSKIIEKNLTVLSKAVYDKGLPREKIFTHTRLNGISSSTEFGAHSPLAALNQYSCPGFSIYYSNESSAIDNPVSSYGRSLLSNYLSSSNIKAPKWAIIETMFFSGSHQLYDWYGYFKNALVYEERNQMLNFYNFYNISVNQNAVNALKKINH